MGNDYARRYHWLSDSLIDFVEEPHRGICCDIVGGKILDMTSKDSKETRDISVDLIKDHPKHLTRYLKPPAQRRLTDFSCRRVEEFSMPPHHPVLDIDLTKQDMVVLQKAYEIQPENYEELISIKGMGGKKIRALALISDLVYGARPSWEDPVKYSFTHGGKDGFPYPVDREVYDNSIQTLKDAIAQAKIDDKERYHAIKRLKEFL